MFSKHEDMTMCYFVHICVVDENEVDELMPGLKVLVRELDDVLLRDVGNRIKESGK